MAPTRFVFRDKRVTAALSCGLVVFALAALSGCGGSVRWRRVSDLDRSLEIEMTDCRLIAQKMSATRNDRTEVYSARAFSRSVKAERNLSKEAIQQYFNECMYQRGWNRSVGFGEAAADATIRDGMFALLDIKVASEGEVLSDGTGYLYRIGARQLSPDIEMRLRGRKAGETVEFVRETISTALAAPQRRRQDVRKYDEIGEQNLAITVTVKALYEVRAGD
jgi:hypothetical protein